MSTSCPALITVGLVALLGCAPQAPLATPEATLKAFVAAVNSRDSVAVKQAYALELTGLSFTFSDLRIESYRITKKTVLDSAAAQARNDRGIVPKAEPGDVQLDVTEVLGGRPYGFTYSLRSFDGRWRIYGHSGVGTLRHEQGALRS